MTKETLIDMYNDECTTPYIEIEGAWSDFQINLINYISKVFKDKKFIDTGHYEGVFKHYEYGWKGLKMLIDKGDLTKKKMSFWFDDYLDWDIRLADFNVTYKWKPKNFKEIFVTIDRKVEEDFFDEEDFATDSTCLIQILSSLSNKKEKTKDDEEMIGSLMERLYPNGL